MPDLAQLLESSRRELLDLSTRNRLISLPVESKSARLVHAVDEKSDEVFRLLVRERKAMSFSHAFVSKPKGKRGASKGGDPKSGAAEASSPGLAEAVNAAASDAANPGAVEAAPELDGDEAIDFTLPEPVDEIDPKTGQAKRHVDLKLQTALGSDPLQRRLIGLYRDAATMIEEQGVNILYLALGRLKWYESAQSDVARWAPLILLPVRMSRKSARDTFKIAWEEEEIQENLSLAAKLRNDFGLSLPPFPDEEDLLPSAYAEAARQAVAEAPRWEVETDAMTLGFFSFAKYLMYRDLDPAAWPDADALLGEEGLGPLLDGGFAAPSAEEGIPEGAKLDPLISAERLDHVVDADSSQTRTIELARRGHSLVVQGPPGTGKSQTIANVLATAALDGKKVLFVAEKLAALEVVKRRLEAIGLGDLCLELHSNKANKRAVLEELGRTWRLGRPVVEGAEALVAKLEKLRARLNAHADALHLPIGDSGVTAFQAIGALASLGDGGRTLGTIELPGCEAWKPADANARRDLLAEAAARVEEMGSPATHAWRGCERETILGIDLPNIDAAIAEAADRLRDAERAAAELAALVRRDAPLDLASMAKLLAFAEHAAASPPLDRQAIGNDAWELAIDALREVVQRGAALAAGKARLAERVQPSAFDIDPAPLRRIVAAKGQSLFRIFSGEYRAAIATMRGFAKGEAPRAYADRVALLDELAEAKGHAACLRDRTEAARRAFGAAWNGEASSWSRLADTLAWVEAGEKAGLGAAFRREFAALDLTPDHAARAKAARQALVAALAALDRAAAEVVLDPQSAFGRATVAEVPFADLLERCGQWRGALEEFAKWSAWRRAWKKGRELGLAPIVDAIADGRLPADEAIATFRRAYHEKLCRLAFAAHPPLREFDGDGHDRLVEEFRDADEARLRLARHRALLRHHDELPKRIAGAGGTGVLLSELERKRGHRSPRRLLRDAGTVVQAIKPIFMMSPLSVAQFLEPGGVEFDLLVVDEASQVQPVDAFGAFARSRQRVVVGDAKQLPPTRFFAKLTSNDEEERDEDEEPMGAQAKDVESILGLCAARGMAESMLRWHYRSRHQSLIAVSNHEFYEGRLFVVPSPSLGSDERGLSFRFVEGGTYDRGKSSTNRVEARAVCAAVVEHARTRPDDSLGVAAFSMAQQKAILDELELVRRDHPELEEFLVRHPHEPFFVKNLENVQGDERDAIFLSVGYGPDADGKIVMNFGPLGGDGGERRLNVLISRAKSRCVVFSSMRADQIDLSRAKGRGVRAFKTFLQYAESGRLSMAVADGREEDSPFEAAVRGAVESFGFEVHPRVGEAGFFVDLGVVDPDRPGRYLLGIECDGAAYHSSLSARDRDRLRQSVLEHHGWTTHRVWSVDWFQRPKRELEKIAAALAAAKEERLEEERRAAEAAPPPPPPAPEPSAVEREESRQADAPALAEPYVVAAFDVPRDVEPHLVDVAAMAAIVRKIVDAEGPVHESEVVARVRDLWGLSRAGSRIQQAVGAAIERLKKSGACRAEESCLDLPDRPVRVRDRDGAPSNSLRKAENLPPAELRAAALAFLRACHGANRDDAVAEAVRLLGFKSVSAGLRQASSAAVDQLLAEGKIVDDEGTLKASV